MQKNDMLTRLAILSIKNHFSCRHEGTSKVKKILHTSRGLLLTKRGITLKQNSLSRDMIDRWCCVYASLNLIFLNKRGNFSIKS